MLIGLVLNKKFVLKSKTPFYEFLDKKSQNLNIIQILTYLYFCQNIYFSMLEHLSRFKLLFLKNQNFRKKTFRKGGVNFYIN